MHRKLIGSYIVKGIGDYRYSYSYSHKKRLYGDTGDFEWWSYVARLVSILDWGGYAVVML